MLCSRASLAARPLVAARVAPVRPALPVRRLKAVRAVPDQAEIQEKLQAWANDTSVVLKVRAASPGGAWGRGAARGGCWRPRPSQGADGQV
jgi:hypothetical protein